MLTGDRLGRCGLLRPGVARLGTAGMVRPVAVRQGEAVFGMAGMARPVAAGRGLARSANQRGRAAGPVEYGGRLKLTFPPSDGSGKLRGMFNSNATKRHTKAANLLTCSFGSRRRPRRPLDRERTTGEWVRFFR